MERSINRSRQGDLGEASAIEWLARQGAVVFLPFGHSPHVDLIAAIDERLLRVQVKTSVCRETTPRGYSRHKVGVATRGGNRSWSGQAKRLDPEQFDLLFVLVGDGRRWLIPARELEATTCLTLGGGRYSEFEIEPTSPLLEAVVGELLESDRAPGERRSRRAGPACKVGALALSEFDSHLPHSQSAELNETKPPGLVRRGTWMRGQTRVSGNRQIAIPKRAFEAAELTRGDRLKAFVTSPGEVTFKRVAQERPDQSGENKRAGEPT